MKIVCKYCKCEISSEVWFRVDGKTEKILTCMTCFSNYLKIMHDIDSDFIERMKSPYWNDNHPDHFKKDD